MRVGIIGTGIMGRATAERLLATGQSVIVWNRSYDKAKPVLAAGAGWAETPAEVARRCQVILSFVTDPKAVEEVSLGPNGILAGIDPDSVHADMSTVLPESAGRMAEAYRTQQGRFLQAPVLGGPKQIASGELLVFAGGPAQDIDQCEPVFASLASHIWRFDTPKQPATAKLACNMLLAHTIVGMGQSLGFAEKGGVPPSTLLDILGHSSMACRMLENKGSTIVAVDYRPNFFLRHMEKDLGLAENAARASGASVPLTEAAHRLFIEAMSRGWGDEDYSAVVKTLLPQPGTNSADNTNR